MIDDVKKTAVSLIESSCAGIAVMLLILIFTSKLIVMPIAKAHRKQKEFITSASHELKTPITVIRADADILQMDNPDNEWIEDIKKQAENLTAMTNSLVSLARMDERNGHIKRVVFLFLTLHKKLCALIMHLHLIQVNILPTILHLTLHAAVTHHQYGNYLQFFLITHLNIHQVKVT